MTVLEKWKDLDCLKTHLKASHMEEFREKVKDLVDKVELQVISQA